MQLQKAFEFIMQWLFYAHPCNLVASWPIICAIISTDMLLPTITVTQEDGLIYKFWQKADGQIEKDKKQYTTGFQFIELCQIKYKTSTSQVFNNIKFKKKLIKYAKVSPNK